MIIIDNLCKKFGSFTALSDVSLHLKKGQTIALLGPNGSGKTTLLKTILGLNIPTSGSVTFNGLAINHQWLYRGKIGYMPQISRFPENMTVKQLLDMMRAIRGASLSLDEELIETFGLRQLYAKTMRTLSGGMRQKVSACIAFLFNPDVLILDEPTAGLDPLSSELLKQKIEKEKSRGKLVLITSHVLSDFDDIVTEVIYMQESKVLLHATITELHAQTGEARLNKIIAAIMQQQLIPQ